MHQHRTLGEILSVGVLIVLLVIALIPSTVTGRRYEADHHRGQERIFGVHADTRR